MTSAEVFERFQNVRVGDIMIPLDRYPCVGPDCTLCDAIALMMKARLDVNSRTSLPRNLLVIDENGALLGCVRRRDILRGLEPKSLISEPLDYRKKLFDVQVDPNLSELSHDKLFKGIREQSRRPVGDVLRPVKATIDFEDHVMKATYEMVSYSLSLLPVLKDRKVVGVVRTVELLAEFSRLVC